MKKWLIMGWMLVGSLWADCEEECCIPRWNPTTPTVDEMEMEYPSCCGCDEYGVGLPPGPIFVYGLADPRRVAISAGWRFDEKIFNDNTCPVSYGDYCGLYRWYHPFCTRGVLQFGVEGALWAIFEQTEESAPLVNADYYVGFPLTYSIDNWVWRLRGFHISSHLGDEFLINHPGFNRVNPSAEYLDLTASYQWDCDLRLYAGLGLILHSDDSFKMRRFYSEFGLDYYLPWLRYYYETSNVLGRPFFGAHFRVREEANYRYDGTMVLGYEWGRVVPYARKVRFFGEWHNGQSYEGQFGHMHTNYYSLTLAYAY